MSGVTLQVLEGLERGRVFEDLPTPVTIGREEDNAICLNDERVSRFHAKIQNDGGRMILTDLESTNGTRVNGHPVQIRVLRPGDRVTIGRSVLVYGSRDEIASRAADLLHRADDPPSDERTLAEREDHRSEPDTPSPDQAPAIADDVLQLFPDGAPELPQSLRAVQQAQLSDLLAFLHDRLGAILAMVDEERPEGDDPAEQTLRIDWPVWQALQALQMDLADYLRRIADPDR